MSNNEATHTLTGSAQTIETNARMARATVLCLLLFLASACASNRPGFGFETTQSIPQPTADASVLCVVKNNSVGDSTREVQFDGVFVGTLHHDSFLCARVPAGEIYLEVINRKGSGINVMDRPVRLQAGQTAIVALDLVDHGGIGSMRIKLRDVPVKYLVNVRGHLRQSIARYQPVGDAAENSPSITMAARPDSLGSPFTGSGAPIPPADLRSGLPPYGSYHALVIGNNDYRKLTPLKTAAQDAAAIADLLEMQYGYDVTLLVDATRADIMSSFARLRRSLSPTDNLLIYYAGHGWDDERAGEAYWLPVDARRDEETQWISNSSITAAIRAMPAKHVLVMADSCYSGTLTRGLSLAPKSSDFLSRLALKRSRTAMTSGGNEPVSDEGSNGHSVFANAVLTALRQNSGVLEASVLFTNIRRPVMLEAEQTPQYGDIRKAGHEGGDFLFIKSQTAGVVQ